MKIDRFMTEIPDALILKEDSETPAPGHAVENTVKEPAQLQRALPKGADSVELSQGSSTYLDKILNAPKVDPNQTNLSNGKEVSAMLIPGVPFREKVELPKTLPNGSSIDNSVSTGNLGFGRNKTGPNHMGIDLKTGGVEIRNQLNDALKLKEGSQGQSSTAPSGTVNYNGLGNQPKTDTTYHGGFQRPGMGLISAEKDGKSGGTLGQKVSDVIDVVKKVGSAVFDAVKDAAVEKFGKIPGTGEGLTILDAPSKIEEVTGDRNDLVRGIAGGFYPENRLNKIYDQGTDKYVTPDADEGTQPPVVTDGTRHSIDVRSGANKTPVPEEYLPGEIDASKLSNADPRRVLIGNPLPDDGANQTVGNIVGDVKNEAKGPDVLNPNDPVLGDGGNPIVLDPNRPK